ncbi:MAG: WbqC family protein, partial [Nitrospirota bacterium]
MKIVSIHQPYFMPWLGYFDKIQRSDYFVFLDTVQFKKNEFQNRNRIRTSQGTLWLTVP